MSDSRYAEVQEGDSVVLRAKVARADGEQAFIEFESMEGPFSVRVPPDGTPPGHPMTSPEPTDAELAEWLRWARGGPRIAGPAIELQPTRRAWVVVYEGHDLHLSEGECVQLHQAAFNDPAEAERLALMHLARETSR